MKKYLAFISYRHTEYDKTIASGLHRSLELLHAPKNEVRFKKRRLFRDEEELPTSSDLGAGIDTALSESEYLIVICSPRLPESKWCLQEIKYFIDNGLTDRILPVLIEGDENVSVPECIRDISIACDLRQHGIGHEDIIRSGNQLKKSVRSAAIKLLSIMTGIKTEDIERSEANHRFVVTATVMLSVIAVIVGFTFYARYTADRISENNTEIMKATNDSEKARESAFNERNNAILSRAKTLSEESRKMIASGDYDGAIINILPVLPSDENPDYPISMEAMAVLRTAMTINQPSYEYARTLDLKTDEDKEIYEKILTIREEAGYVPDEDVCTKLGINMKNIISIDNNHNYVALVRTDGILDIYSTGTGRRIATSEKKYRQVYFTDKPSIIYAIAENRNIELLETKTLEPIRTLDCNNKAKQIYVCENKKYLLITCDDSIEIFRHDNGRHMYSYHLDAEPDFAIFSDYDRLFAITRGEMFYVVFPDHVDLYRTKQDVDSDESDFVPFIDESYRQSIKWCTAGQNEDAFYIQDAGGPIFTWDVKTGKLLWRALPNEYFAQESGFDTCLSVDGKAIWYPQGSMGSLKKLDAHSGEAIFEINPKVMGQFHESEDSNIVILQGKYGTSNIIEGIDGTSGNELWLWEQNQKKKFFNLRLSEGKLYLIEAELDEYENIRNFYFLIVDAKTGDIIERKNIITCSQDVSWYSMNEINEHADITIGHGKTGETDTGDEEFIVDMSSGDIVKHYEGPETEGTLYQGYTHLFRKKTPSIIDTGEHEEYYAFVDENGVTGKYQKIDTSVYYKKLVMENSIIPFRDRKAVIFNNTLIDYETGEPLMYLDSFSVDNSGNPNWLIVSSNENFSGSLYLSDDMELIRKAHRRVRGIK